MFEYEEPWNARTQFWGYSSRAEAIAAWNRRAIPATDARAEALKEAASVAAKFDSDGMYGAAAIHDAILVLIGEADVPRE